MHKVNMVLTIGTLSFSMPLLGLNVLDLLKSFISVCLCIDFFKLIVTNSLFSF